MRLLFALPGFHRFDRGAEVALLNVARTVADQGDRVTVMGSGEQRSGTPYTFVHVPAVSREKFERFPFLPPLRSETAWEDATFAINLLRRFDPADYDAVITCSFPFTNWALRRPSRNRPTQVFVTQNGDWPAVSDRSEYRTFGCDLLICTNPDYLANNQGRWNSVLIPNGVDLNQFGPGSVDRAQLGVPTEGKIVLMVSALIETKRVLDGIRAVAGIAGARLVVAGDGPLRSEAERLAAELMPNRYHRVSLPAARMPDLYRAADAFLHLSLLESFGNVFLEAWASALPIVAHDSERLRWIFGDRCDYLCDTQDETVLQSALRAALGGGAAEPGPGINRFSWETIGAEYRTAIAEAIARRSVG